MQVLDLRKEAQRMIVDKYQLAPNMVSYSAEQLADFIVALSVEYIDTQLQLARYSKIIDANSSESNKLSASHHTDSAAADTQAAAAAESDDAELDEAVGEKDDVPEPDEVTAYNHAKRSCLPACQAVTLRLMTCGRWLKLSSNISLAASRTLLLRRLQA